MRRLRLLFAITTAVAVPGGIAATYAFEGWRIAAVTWAAIAVLNVGCLALLHRDCGCARVRLPFLERLLLRRSDQDEFRFITVWHNTHHDRLNGWKPDHPMTEAFTFPALDFLRRGSKDTGYDLDEVHARFAHTGDPGQDILLATYQEAGLRPLQDGDVIEISGTPQVEQCPASCTAWTSERTRRWRVGPNGWIPVTEPLTFSMDNSPF
ncbi:hypothetical protein [Nonomuraea dietziae]|uniref:Uncharacterized protein n=1 Tax=Nonomuraea dietziae TaxID=65515 RepID=A0A7W5VLV1_9ACTN|nr:hypothetical protein [Nonomuraea dietziae]MBB3734044.1 hypothetical protein [Nonomuraea dietziae]